MAVADNKIKSEGDNSSVLHFEGMGSQIVALILLLAVVVTALGVVFSSYKSRQLFSELQGLSRAAIQMEEEWGRLLLEQSTWASHARIERLAKTKLKMVEPDSKTIVVVKE